MHSSDVSEVQFVPVGMDDTVEEVRQRVAELPSFAGRVFTLHAEGVLLETGPFSATGIEDGGAVQVQTTHVDENTTLEEQFLEACKELDKKEPDTTLLVQQLSLLERRWVASDSTQTKTKMVHFLNNTVEKEEVEEEESTVEEESTDEWDSTEYGTDEKEDGTGEEEEDNTIPPGSRWEDLSNKDKKLGAALQEAGFDVYCVNITYTYTKRHRREYSEYGRHGHRYNDGYSYESSEESFYPGSSGSSVEDYEVTASCWPDEAGPPQNVKALLPLDSVTRDDFVMPEMFYAKDGDTGTALVFWPRRWRALHIRYDQSFPLLWEACRGLFDPKDLGCADIVALQELYTASVVKWTPTLRATMLECVSQPSMPGPAAATFLTDHFTLSTISEAEVASLERLLQRDTPAINTAFLNVFQVYRGMEKAGCAADVLLRLAKKGVNTALLKRCADCAATSRAVCSRGSKTHAQKTEPITHFTITILRLLLHLDMKAEMEKVVDQIQKNNKKYRVVPVSGAALALMDDAATVEASASLVKIAQSRLQRKDVLVSSEKHMDASEVAVLMRFIACCVDAEEGKALLKKVARCTKIIPRCAAVLKGALTALKGVPALGVAPVCFPAGMCQEWVWSCVGHVIGDSSKSKCEEVLSMNGSKTRAPVTLFVTATTLLQHLGGGAPAVQHLLDTPIYTSLMQDRRTIEDLADAVHTKVKHSSTQQYLGGAVLDVIYSRCIEHLHKTCPFPKKPKTWHLDDTLRAPCCDDCRVVCRFFASDYAKEITIRGRNVTREGHVSKSVLALPGQGRTFKAEVLSSARATVNGMLRIRKVHRGQATLEELEQYDNNAEEYTCVHMLINKLEARKRALPKEETPPSTEHDPDAEEAVQDSPGEPPLKRRRVDT